MGRGTQFRKNVGTSSHPVEISVEVVAYQRPTTFAFEVTREVYVTTYEWIFQPTSDGTRVSFKMRTRMETRWGRVLGLLFFLIIDRGELDEQRFRHVLEEQ